MNFADLLSGFVNEQIVGMAVLLVGIGFAAKKYFNVEKKKIPLLFILITLPVSILYQIFLNPDIHIYVNVMNGIYQSAFAMTFAMGFYDLGKSLWRSIKYRIRRDNPTKKEDDPNAI